LSHMNEVVVSITSLHAPGASPRTAPPRIAVPALGLPQVPPPRTSSFGNLESPTSPSRRNRRCAVLTSEFVKDSAQVKELLARGATPFEALLSRLPGNAQTPVIWTPFSSGQSSGRVTKPIVKPVSKSELERIATGLTALRSMPSSLSSCQRSSSSTRSRSADKTKTHERVVAADKEYKEKVKDVVVCKARQAHTPSPARRPALPSSKIVYASQQDIQSPSSKDQRLAQARVMEMQKKGGGLSSGSRVGVVRVTRWVPAEARSTSPQANGLMRESANATPEPGEKPLDASTGTQPFNWSSNEMHDLRTKFLMSDTFDNSTSMTRLDGTLRLGGGRPRTGRSRGASILMDFVPPPQSRRNTIVRTSPSLASLHHESHQADALSNPLTAYLDIPK
jgi:hypothetical protein